MKLNKPTVTVPQTELENYVASMLVDPDAKAEDEPLKPNTEIKKPAEKASTTERANNKSSIRLVTNKNTGQKNKTKRTGTTEIDSLSEVASVIKQSITEDKSSKSINLLGQNKIKPTLLKGNIPTNVKQPLKPVTIEFAEADDVEKDPRLKNVEKLLAQIALAKIPKTDQKTSPKAETKTQVVVADKKEEFHNTKDEVDNQQLITTMESSFEHRENTPLKEELGSVFQTLVFEVNQLPMAVPLVKLGGIIDLSGQEITPLVGTPDWFMGLVPNERGNLLVVDTQRFIMPEREQPDQPDYKFLIVLDNSQWAIACHSVDDAKNLSPDDIRWSARTSQRPWFAGMVVEYMSALIEVDELINMLADNIVE